MWDHSQRPSSSAPVTDLLERAREGDEKALEEVYAAVYTELQRLARLQRRKVAFSDQTLNTTALVHETYLRLCPRDELTFESRAHFLAVAAKAMRQILVDGARRRLRKKRGEGVTLLELDAANQESLGREDTDATLLLSVNEALDSLQRENPRLQKVIECRFFGGMTETETAEVLGVSDRTIRRDWLKARAWLRLYLDPTRHQP